MNSKNTQTALKFPGYMPCNPQTFESPLILKRPIMHIVNKIGPKTMKLILTTFLATQSTVSSLILKAKTPVRRTQRIAQ
jgi:hypothetical protein